MTILLWTFYAVLIGVAIGSFVNAVVFRTSEGEGLGGRSKCRSCLKPIAAKDLIPVVSFFLLKRRCRKCKAVIEWQYPVVELAMGILFGLLFARAAYFIGFPSFVDSSEWLALFVRDAIMVTFLVIIFIYDLRASVILDRFSIPAMILALVLNVGLGADPADLLLGGIILGAFFGFQYVISKGKWIGGGDIRMGLVMGFLLGVNLGIVALFSAYVLGAIVGIGLILFGRKTLKSHVPFGTFLATGTLIAMIWGQDILNWYLGFFA